MIHLLMQETDWFSVVKGGLTTILANEWFIAGTCFVVPFYASAAMSSPTPRHYSCACVPSMIHSPIRGLSADIRLDEGLFVPSARRVRSTEATVSTHARTAL